MKFIIFYILVSFSSISIFVIGEYISSNFPNNRFSKWWRKYVVAEEKDI